MVRPIRRSSWEMKRDAIRPEERDAARAAYMDARRIYETAAAEAVTD